MNSCSLTSISNEFGNLEKLNVLDLGNNPSIEFLPISFKNLQNLEIVILNNTGLRTVPEAFLQSNNSIRRLKLSFNNIKVVPDGLENLKSLQYIDFEHNQVVTISQNIGNIETLTELFLNNNKIKIVPNTLCKLHNLKELSIANNEINNIPPIFDDMKKLNYFNISGNQISIIPTNIVNAVNLKKFAIHNNPILMLHPQILRFIDGFHNHTNILNDDQNIHNSTVQKNFIKSVEAISSQFITINSEKIIKSVNMDQTLSKQCKNAIYKMYMDTTIHVILKMTLKELFEYVWSTIHYTIFTVETQEEMKKIMNEDIIASESICFVGKMTRLIAILNGFSPLVNITISESEDIAITIEKIKSELNRTGNYTVENHKEKTKKELIDMGISNETINEWISYIE
jgi:hypothetical protein